MQVAAAEALLFLVSEVVGDTLLLLVVVLVGVVRVVEAVVVALGGRLVSGKGLRGGLVVEHAGQRWWLRR